MKNSLAHYKIKKHGFSTWKLWKWTSKSLKTISRIPNFYEKNLDFDSHFCWADM